MISQEIQILNERGTIILHNTATDQKVIYNRILAYDLDSFTIEFAGDNVRSGEIEIDKVIAPSITTELEFETWIGALSLGESSDIMPAPTRVTSTADSTILANFLYAKVEAPMGMIASSTVSVGGIVYDDNFVGVEFDRVESGADIAIVTNGNTIAVTQVR